MKRIITGSLILAALMILFSGCTGMPGTISIGIGTAGSSRSGSAVISTASLGAFENNSTVRLQAARYQGDLDVRANKVVLTGVSSDATEIMGDVRIFGNSCTLRALSVRGSVYLYGNNNDVSAARIGGNVISEGNNNSW